MNFILKQIDAYAVRTIGEFESFEKALEAKEAAYEKSEFMECFIEIVAPKGKVLAAIGEMEENEQTKTHS